MSKNFILASQSPHRLALLEQIGYAPEKVEPADIDETPYVGEKPSQYVKRMALEKALYVVGKHNGEVVLASDTVIVYGTTIVQKSKTEAEQEVVMKKLSGRTHRVLTSVCVVDKQGKASVRLSTTKVKMKRLSDKELAEYVSSGDWRGCAGYKIDGILGGFVSQIIGSYSGVVGLPLYEARNLLIGAGVL